MSARFLYKRIVSLIYLTLPIALGVGIKLYSSLLSLKLWKALQGVLQ